MFPSNVARLGWLVDTSCADREAEVKVGVKVSESKATLEAGVESDEEDDPKAVQQVVYYQAGVGSRGSFLPRTLDGT